MKKHGDPTVLTTTEAAKAIGVSRQTVVKAFDSKIIPGWKIPGSQDRRINLKDFLRYCRQNKIPVNLPTHQLALFPKD